MKVLSAILYFKLPDDFSGTESDALRLLADYYEKKDKKNKVIFSELYKVSTLSIPELWNKFLDFVFKGYRVHGNLLVSDTDEKYKVEK